MHRFTEIIGEFVTASWADVGIGPYRVPRSGKAACERLVRLNEDIIRYMTVKVEDFNNEVASEEDAAVAEA